MKRVPLAIAALFSIFLLPAAAHATTGYSNANVNLRAGPDIWYPAVAVVPAGAPVTVYGCIYGLRWCDVGWGPLRGWISSRYLTVPYQSRRVIVADAPWLSMPVISFHFGNYWDRYYRGRPFYRERPHWERRHRDHWSSRSGRSGGRSSWSQPHEIAPQVQPQPQPQEAGQTWDGRRSGDWDGERRRRGDSQGGNWSNGGSWGDGSEGQRRIRNW